MTQLLKLWLQRRRAVPAVRNRFDGTSDVSTTSDTQTGSVPSGVASPTRRHAAYDGQRRDVLRPALLVHLYIQVFPTIVSVSDYFGYFVTHVHL